jgi:hypothetical protein
MVFTRAAAAAARAPPPPPRQTYISNGRVVSQSERPPSFSGRKFLFVWIVGLAFWFTNPGNAPFLTTLETIYQDYLEPAGFPASSPLPPGVKNAKKTSGDRGGQHITNFGFFSVNERITRVELHALGQQIDCRFGDETFGWFCQALQADLCHQKPLFWDPHDRPYSTHRLLSWSLIAAGMLAFSVQDSNKHALLTGNLLVDSFLTIWFPSDSSSWTCLRSTVSAIWQSAFFLYPVWMRMDILVPIQHPNSWFRIVDDHEQNDWNYALSVLFVILLAAGANAAAKMVTGRFLLRECEAVVAVALGYYRGSLSDVSSAATAISFPVLQSLSVNLTALHWTALLTMLTRMDLSVFFWLYANMLGAFMGEYQYQNQFTLTLVRQVWRSFENTLDAFFGYR